MQPNKNKELAVSFCTFDGLSDQSGDAAMQAQLAYCTDAVAPPSLWPYTRCGPTLAVALPSIAIFFVMCLLYFPQGYP